MAEWNKDTAVQHIQTNALEGFGDGQCAKFTRQAIEAGGLRLERPATGSAKDYGPSLIKAGFSSLGQYTGVYRKGDIVIIDGFSGKKGKYRGSPDGHAAIYDGRQWVSDHKQSDLYPGPGYRAAKPTFTIYRLGN
ncbi:hypothetical protein DYU11_09080 [Fibrisoma montanum]|uniref:NlpC/P60 domain-containing protein n=1 Tax=Fibrisoma montanum TaxID=2305895 RepID=A0A418MF79_9BACT|nr:hypothetical protein [Fibrisoma montanum]RIV25441.1 hypothetical protein DYU11_09080 [Fibrisoma montanum]